MLQLPKMRFFLLPLLALIFVTVSASAKHHHHHHPTVYILRHGEKSPNSKNHQLNSHGYKRAECLRSVFGEESPYDIGYILAPHVAKDGSHRRSFDTVHPLARDLGLPVDTPCKSNHAQCLAKHIKRYEGTGNILISWRHGKMKRIAAELGLKHLPEYPEDRYDLVWTIPYPYTQVTEMWSEECPGLDYDDGFAPLKVQV